MKLISGEWKWGETVTIEVDGKIIKRKVHYGVLDSLYIIYDYEKIGIDALEKDEQKN